MHTEGSDSVCMHREASIISMPSACLLLWVQVSCSVGRQCLGSSGIPRSLTAVTAPVIKLVNSTFVPSAVIRVKQVSLPRTCSLNITGLTGMLLVLIAKACSSSLAAYHHEVTACSVFVFSNSTVSDFDVDQIGFCSGRQGHLVHPAASHVQLAC